MTDTDALEQKSVDGEQQFKITSQAILEVRRAKIIAEDIADEPEETKQNVLNGYENMAKGIGRSPAELLETGERIIQNDKEIDRLYADAKPGQGGRNPNFRTAYERIPELRQKITNALSANDRSPEVAAQAIRIISHAARLSLDDKEQWQHIYGFVRAAPDLLQDRDTAQAIFANLEQQRYFYDLDPNDMTDRRSQRNFERWRDETYDLIALMTENPTNLSREQRETIQNWHYMREGNQYYQKLGDASRPYIDGKALETNTVVENIRTAAYSALPDRIKSQIDEGKFYKMLEERRIDFSRYSGDTNNLLPEVAGLIAEAIPGLAGKEFFALGLVQNIGVYARDASTAYTGARVLRAFTGEQTVLEYRNNHLDSQWYREFQTITPSHGKGLNPLFRAISDADVREKEERAQQKHDAEAAVRQQEESVRIGLQREAKEAEGAQKPDQHGWYTDPTNNDHTVATDGLTSGEPEVDHALPIESSFPQESPITSSSTSLQDKIDDNGEQKQGGIGGAIRNLFGRSRNR